MGLKKERNYIFDIARGIAMILIITGHTLIGSRYTVATNALFVGNLALFFFVSGYFGRIKKWRDVLITVVNTLVVPLIFGLLGWLFIETVLARVPLIDALRGMAYLSGGSNYSIRLFAKSGPFIGALWFLVAMIWTTFVFQLLLRLKTRTRLALSFGLLVLGMWISTVYYLPWSLNAVLIAQSYVIIGNFAKVNDWYGRLKQFKFIVVLTALVLWLCVASITSYGLNAGTADHIVPAYIGSLSSIIVILYVASLLNLTRTKYMLTWIGEYSIVVLIIHSMDLAINSSFEIFSVGKAFWITHVIHIGATYTLAFLLLRLLGVFVFAYLILKAPMFYKILVDRQYPIKLN